MQKLQLYCQTPPIYGQELHFLQLFRQNFTYISISNKINCTNCNSCFETASIWAKQMQKLQLMLRRVKSLHKLQQML